MKETLAKDPYNIVITGVGGQGNVMASRVLSNMLVRRGFKVTIGETFGMSQRGGSVMSHIRVSSASVWSPQIPKGGADLIVAIEPIEEIRVLAEGGPTWHEMSRRAAELAHPYASSDIARECLLLAARYRASAQASR